MPLPTFPNPHAPGFQNPWTDPDGVRWAYLGAPKNRWNKLQGHAGTHSTEGDDPIYPEDIGAAAENHTHTPAALGAVPAPLILDQPPVNGAGYPTPLVTVPEGLRPYVLVSNTLSVGPVPYTPTAVPPLIYAGEDAEFAKVWTSDGNLEHPESGEWWEVKLELGIPSTLTYYVGGWIVSSWASNGELEEIDETNTWVVVYGGSGVPVLTTAEAPTAGKVGQRAIVGDDNESQLFECVNEDPPTWLQLSAAPVGTPSAGGNKCHAVSSVGALTAGLGNVGDLAMVYDVGSATVLSLHEKIGLTTWTMRGIFGGGGGDGIPALAYVSPSGEPYLSPTGEYYLAPA